MKMKVTTINIDINEYKKFKKIAVEQDKSISFLIRKMIKELIKEKGE